MDTKPPPTSLHQDADKILLLKTIPFFTELPDEDIAWFIKRARFVEYSKHNFLFQHGDPADALYIIMEGWIKIYRDDMQGEQVVQAILTRGDTFGEESVVTGRSYPCNAQVVGKNTKCLVISGDILRERIENMPGVAFRMISALADQLNKTGYFLEIHSKLTAPQRLGAFLLKLSMDRQNTPKVQLPYNKLMVAARLGMQPETLSRAMRRLKEDLNIEFKGRDVTIPDLNALQDYCEAYCCKSPECSPTQKLLCTEAHCDIFRMLRMM